MLLVLAEGWHLHFNVFERVVFRVEGHTNLREEGTSHPLRGSSFLDLRQVLVSLRDAGILRCKLLDICRASDAGIHSAHPPGCDREEGISLRFVHLVL